jgi:NitT/TauT family transport system substrate-binding protein
MTGRAARTIALSRTHYTKGKTMSRRFLILFCALALTSAGPTGCGKKAEEPPAPEKTEMDTPSPEPLRMALLPILDVLPFHVAEAKGYFAEEGVAVEAVPVASALERDQLLQSGEVDGMLGEMAAAAVFNREQTTIKVVMSARKATAEAALFRIIAPPKSDITSPAQLSGVPVAISENTIIEYVTDRLLEAEGLKPDDIVSQSVPAIPERFQLLMEGKIKAATLPDPLGESALTAGAVLVLDDRAHPEYAVSILAVSAARLEVDPEGVKGFLRAWNRAAADINAAPESFHELFLAKVRVPPNVKDSYGIPPFPIAEIPTEEQWQDVTSWLASKGLIEGAPAYAESVTAAFITAVE